MSGLLFEDEYIKSNIKESDEPDDEDIDYDNLESTEDEDDEDEDDEDSQELTPSDPSLVYNIRYCETSISDLMRWNDEGRLIYAPEFQRGYVWTDAKPSKLIESILLGIPIPPLYLMCAHDEDRGDIYTVIDGRQRVETIINFLSTDPSKAFKTKGLTVLTAANKKTYSQLAPKSKTKLQDAKLQCHIVDSTINNAAMYEIFERLNTGAVKLTKMELRNCVFRGTVNSLITRLATDCEDFLICTNSKEKPITRMGDRDLVLRFMAFNALGYEKCCKVRLEKFIAEFYDKYQHADAKTIKQFKQDFKHAVKACRIVFGRDGCRQLHVNKKGELVWNTVISARIFQIISTAFVKYSYEDIRDAKVEIYNEYMDILDDEEWVKGLKHRSYNKPVLAYTFSSWYNRLDRVMTEHAKKSQSDNNSIWDN